MKITAPHCLEWVNRSSPREVRGEGRGVVKSGKLKPESRTKALGRAAEDYCK